MDFFGNFKSVDKLLNNDWKSLVYGEQSETWKEKLYLLAREARSQISTFLESRGRQLQNYWPLYAAFFVGSFVILVTYKSLRYVGSIKLRNTDKRERQVKQEITTRESRIISDVAVDNDNEDTESLVENPRLASLSDVDDATATRADNDNRKQRDSGASSSTAVVLVGEEKQTGEFLRNLINSIKPGDDASSRVVSTKDSREETEENKETPDLPELTRQKVDSNNCKHFYVLTPWIGPAQDRETRADSPTYSVPTTRTVEPSMQPASSNPEIVERKEKNKADNSDLVKSDSPDAVTENIAPRDEDKTTRKSAESTLAVQHESSSVCCADDLLSRISDTGENIVSRPETENSEDTSAVPKPKPENLERVFSNLVQTLPDLDLSPISRDPMKIEAAMNGTETLVRTDSRPRHRSLSHDQRPATNAGYIDVRRGGSVSPPARNKNKQRPDAQMQSKIPTPSPRTHRRMQRHLETDGTIAETANQIRSVLLRKLKEVWEQHPRDRTPSPDRSMNSSNNSSVYYTPDNVSRIPLLRRSPRDANDSSIGRSFRDGGQSDRSANPTGQSRPSHSRIANDGSFPVDASAVPMHSTPKTSPLSQGGNRRR